MSLPVVEEWYIPARPLFPLKQKEGVTKQTEEEEEEEVGEEPNCWGSTFIVRKGARNVELNLQVFFVPPG